MINIHFPRFGFTCAGGVCSRDGDGYTATRGRGTHGQTAQDQENIQGSSIAIAYLCLF